MNFEEFLEPKKQTIEEAVERVNEEEIIVEPAELDIQKAVVEELAADKAQLSEKIKNLDEKRAELEEEVEKLRIKTHEQEIEKERLVQEVASLKKAYAEIETKFSDLIEKQFDEQSRNPNALALLDREVELPDRFPGETRDHVLEVVRDARNQAEREGRIRRAQLLEGVLVANEPHGNLAKKRAALEKFFNENANILSGPVLSELERCGISYKDGEKYLLTSEILKRTY